MKICVISDVHGKWKNLVIPDCDLLVSCGDFSFRGEEHLLIGFHEWLAEQTASHIISVNGNHECLIEKNFALAKETVYQIDPEIHFIGESGLVEIEGLKIWGSAVTPWFYDWAWNVSRGTDIQKVWDKIPLDTDILITHGPPYGILDLTPQMVHAGCDNLTETIKKLPKLKAHLFGHIHQSYGQTEINGVKYINAAICNESYLAVNKPIVIEI